MLKKINIFKEVPFNNGKYRNPVVTIGNFDGVHLGHRKIIEKLLERADSMSGEAFLLTFNNHPRELLKPDLPCRMITTIEEKIEAIESLGVKNIILLDFSEELLNLTAWQFYNDLLIGRLGVVEIVIGYDHHFGKNREGNYQYLSGVSHHHGTVITRVQKEVFEHEIVSSTMLRERIDEGEIINVNQLLGRRFTLKGKVVHGEGRGRGLGAPTANIEPELSAKITPGYGVYAVEVIVERGQKYQGVMSIGVNPTFGGHRKSIEVHIFDFDDNIYGTSITVEFVKKIRDEMKFDNPADLSRQIKNDIVQAKEILKNYE